MIPAAVEAARPAPWAGAAEPGPEPAVNRILLRDCYRVLLPDGSTPSGLDVLIEGNRIVLVGKVPAERARAARIIDASNHVVLPGLVNTHHHFYQTLTRNIPAVQDAKLFDWLVYLYEIWKGLDEDAIYWSSRLAAAELLKTGCTLSTDHHYLYPTSFSGDLPGLQFDAAAELGLRFAPTRGSMSRSKKDGGLPPDTTVQDEDRILADSEAAIRKYHDAAPDAMRKLALAPCSPFSVSEKAMREAAELGRRYGVRLHTHLAETSDEDDFCVKIYGRRPLKLMEDTGFLGKDVWYAHGIFFNDQELEDRGRRPGGPGPLRPEPDGVRRRPVGPRGGPPILRLQPRRGPRHRQRDPGGGEGRPPRRRRGEDPGRSQPRRPAAPGESGTGLRRHRT